MKSLILRGYITITLRREIYFISCFLSILFTEIPPVHGCTMGYRGCDLILLEIVICYGYLWGFGTWLYPVVSVGGLIFLITFSPMYSFTIELIRY